MRSNNQQGSWQRWQVRSVRISLWGLLATLVVAMVFAVDLAGNDGSMSLFWLISLIAAAATTVLAFAFSLVCAHMRSQAIQRAIVRGAIREPLGERHRLGEPKRPDWSRHPHADEPMRPDWSKHAYGEGGQPASSTQVVELRRSRPRRDRDRRPRLKHGRQRR